MEMEMESFIRRKPLLTLHVYDTHVACTDHACAVVILGLCHSCGRQLLGQIEQETKVCMEGGQSKKKEGGGEEWSVQQRHQRTTQESSFVVQCQLQCTWVHDCICRCV